MKRIEAYELAANWVDLWNRKDVEAVLEHYCDDVIFMSPKATNIVGQSLLEGKEALSQYWKTACEKIEKIEFKLDRVVWDPETSELVVIYEANLNGVRSRACETMRFDPSGKIVSGEAMYGAPR
jgi:ketosteroid isomerase-like protein